MLEIKKEKDKIIEYGDIDDFKNDIIEMLDLLESTYLIKIHSIIKCHVNKLKGD